MTVNVGGLVSIAVFYLIILGVGLWAARKKKADSQTEDIILAGRSISFFVGAFTMTATWVGGAYINGTAEAVAQGDQGQGLVWAQAPWGYALSLVIGGTFYAGKMRSAGYMTMLDPFVHRFGDGMAGLLFIPAVLGETFWSAAILNALGATVSVIIELNRETSVIVSAAIALCYTMVGGLYSVAYTDVIQLACIFVGLWLAVPFVLTSDDVGKLSNEPQSWLGTWESDQTWVWLDYALLLICGGIPWQVYFQRVLSAKDARAARFLSYFAAVGAIVMAIPAVLIGAAASKADWIAAGTSDKFVNPDNTLKDYTLTLPLVLQELTPEVVAIIGLGSVSAAVMSSADSSMLSASSLFSWNVYRPLRKAISGNEPSEKELIWAIRGAMVIVGSLATVMALTIDTIYGLWYLCSDLVYCILFPQLTTVLYYSKANTYGSAAGYLVGALLRFGGGEPLVDLPPFIYYPGYKDGEQMFPFRTLAMACSLVTILVVSWATHQLYERDIINEDNDFFGAFFSDSESRKASLFSRSRVDSSQLWESKAPSKTDEQVFNDAIDKSYAPASGSLENTSSSSNSIA
eukprot:Clim_evm4s230 gene=Clim_evmTU4s230